MNEDTTKIYEFLKENNYIDDRGFTSIEIKIDTENLPIIKVTYPIREVK